MGKKSKYAGGSTVVSFRLPTKHLKDAKARVIALLGQYEYGSGRTPEDLKRYFDQLMGTPIQFEEPVPRGLEWFSEALKKKGTEFDLEAEKKLLFGDTITEFINDVSNNAMEPYRIPSNEEWDEKAAESKPFIDGLISEGFPGTWDKLKYPELDPESGEGRLFPSLGSALLYPVTPEEATPPELIIEKLPPTDLDNFMAEKQSPTDNGLIFPCGCMKMEKNGLFRRKGNCTIPKAEHKF